MATAMATGACQAAQVTAATRVVDSSPVSTSTVAVVGVQLRQSSYTGAGLQSLKGAVSEQHHARTSRNVGARAMAESSPSTPPPAVKETYEVELEKPWGLRFYKGADGGTYIDAIAPGGSADRTGAFTPGDKVIETSAMFGSEMWPAAEYGRTMYTIRQRIGTLLMRMEKRYGVREDRGASAEKLSQERNAGSIGDGIREIQVQNYLRKQEQRKQREEELNAGLKLYKSGKYEDALVHFESVLGLKPEAREEAVASYNVACCYSKLNQIDSGLQALEEAMQAGFDDYKTVREDPDLAKLRSAPGFTPLINKYDEPFINENAMNAIKNVFGFFGKK
ncbi:hypothetical protein M758_11G148200 [Ceratodon purpureus]|uniref:PDZ domain-containing protein n=1 Tax=Ceratodon purpureus TaxID=3225 RepID=A0A8T0GE91_CERPU|nr:hypothetical protein KC19_11G152600 [Ceratodon purpureus]KAG0601923.1 hypothetical protein M758_11G148200 [Ceratodon purpureus]